MAASNASENLSSSYGDCDNEQTLIYGTGDDANRISPEELRKLLSGHLCRCTGYENILNAVEKTMKKRLGKA